MATELDFTPPEIPEPTFMENILHYGLFFGAIFQLICVLAIILPIPKLHKTNAGALLAGFLWVNHILQEVSQDTEGFESKSAEVVKKTKAVAASASKKPKKETKKKR